MIQFRHKGMYYRWAERTWITGDNKKVARSFAMQLNELYANQIQVNGINNKELSHYAFDMEKQKHYGVACVLYTKLFSEAQKELRIKDMDTLLFRLCTIKYRLMDHEGAIDLFETYGRNTNFKQFRAQMRVLYTKDFERIEEKFNDFESDSIFSKVWRKKKKRKTIFFTLWGGCDYHQRKGKLHMIINHEKQYRYVCFDVLEKRVNANQVLLFGYAYVASLLEEPCDLVFTTNAPAGITGMFDIWHNKRPLKKKANNLIEKKDVQRRIFEGKHVLKKEIVETNTYQKIEHIVKLHELKNTINIKIYEDVYKKHIQT